MAFVDPDYVFAGIEGGATHSKFVLLGVDGQQLYWKDMPGTNYHLIGVDNFTKLVNEVVTEAKGAVHIAPSTPLAGLGMAMAGAEDEKANRELINHLRESYPDMAKHYYLSSDSVGTIATSVKNGGVVLIAGTGSTCRLMNPSGEIHGTGGWGHIIGDQSSAFWIAMEAVKAVFNDEEGLHPSEYETGRVKALMFEYFGISELVGILGDMYGKFDKPKIAGFCAKLASCAKDEHDYLCRDIFRRAGFELGRHVIGVCRHADLSLLKEGALPIVTVGSVWKSFALLKPGFLAGLQPRYRSDVSISKIRLLRLTASSAIGAAVLVAKVAGQEIAIDFSQNVEDYYQTEL